jgi:hypothetical protein
VRYAHLNRKRESELLFRSIRFFFFHPVVLFLFVRQSHGLLLTDGLDRSNGAWSALPIARQVREFSSQTSLEGLRCRRVATAEEREQEKTRQLATKLHEQSLFFFPAFPKRQKEPSNDGH